MGGLGRAQRAPEARVQNARSPHAARRTPARPHARTPARPHARTPHVRAACIACAMKQALNWGSDDQRAGERKAARACEGQEWL
eukprot:3348862-Prymnesium_polylepis.1